MHSPANDTFELYDLRVEIAPESGPIVGKHAVGEYFEVRGEDIFLPPGQGFSLYALGAIIPLLAAKQRMSQPNDFYEKDDLLIADPDVHSKAVYRVTRTGTRTFRHADVSGAPHSSTAS